MAIHLPQRTRRRNPRSSRERRDDELLGESIWEVIPEAVDTRFYDEYHEAMERQTPRTFEERYEPLDAWFDVHAYPSETGLSVYFLDVTERKRLEANLRRRETMFRRMYWTIADGSSSFEEKVGALLEIGQEALGTDYAALSRIEDGDYVFEFVRDPDGEIQPGDVTPLGETHCERAIVTEETLVAGDIAEDAPELADRGGYTERGIECYVGTPVVVDGEVSGTFCFSDDEPRSEAFSDWQVTLVELMGNWVSYEQEREQRECELSRQRDRLDEFANIISHDLRNPLNVAQGRLSLIREDYDGNREQFDAVEDALDRIENIVDDTLTLAREGRTVTELQPVSLGDVAAECWAMVESPEAVFEVVGDRRIRADANRLRQVFENLFRNAVEHGSTSPRSEAHGNAVKRRSPSVSVTVGPIDGEGFYVADDGPGIPAEEREDVFELGHTTTDAGTGFGLAIVSQIARSHGWTVTVADGIDGGTRFEFRGVEFT